MNRISIDQLYTYFVKSSGVCTDSRSVKQQSIFFAFRGESFDGNKFAKSAIDSGATIAIIDNPDYFCDGCFLVDNTLLALQQLAKYHREQLKAKVIGITGTNGKTTTKELLYAVLSKKYKTVATRGNFNNQIGVPLTLLSISNDVEVAIIEMGANHLGDIEELVNIAEPNYGLITNIGRAHLDGFGSFEGVVKTKTELYRYLKTVNGTIIYNNNNQILAEQVERICYGNTVQYSSYINGYEIVENSGPYLNIAVKVEGINSELNINTQLVGKYNLENVMAAITIGRLFDVHWEDIKSAIEMYTPTNNRSQYIRTARNTVIMDAYNANPTSMELALKNFIALPETNKMVILGEMLELGSYSDQEHQKIVEQLETSGIDNAILIGEGFFEHHNSFKYFINVDKCIEHLQNHTISGNTILLKGSHGVRLDKLLQLL